MKKVLMAAIAVAIAVAPASGRRGVATYDFGTLQALEVNANLRIKKVMGAIGTLGLAEFTAGWKSAPHHHTHEQIDIGVSGAFDIVTATPQHVSRLRGLLIPPDLAHHNAVSAENVNALFLEFQPVRRVDLPPERQKVAFPVASVPLAGPVDGLSVDFTGEAREWERLPTGIRRNVKNGKRTAVSAWEIPAAATGATPLTLQLPGAEQFVYVFDGSVEMGQSNQWHPASTGVVWLNPPGSPSIEVRANSGRAALLLAFEAKP